MTTRTHETRSENTENFGVPWEKDYGYSQAIRIGNRIYLAGQISHDDGGNLVAVGDMQGQIRQAYANIRTLLERFGGSIGAVVEETLYVTDIDAGMAGRGALQDEVFGANGRPASTMVEIKRLAFPELLVEIRCVAEL
jgi:enamine deaminase RidA (YjgF/YER057c/UK114 family)